MKRAVILLAGLVLAAAPLRAGDDVSDFQGRLEIGVEKKIIKGLTVSLEEQLRMSNSFTTFDRLHTTLGIEYKVNPYFRVGGGVIMINNYKPTSKKWVHKERFYVDLTGRYKTGIVILSLKERLQLTHRNGSFNTAETTPNLLALKSRAKITLDFGQWEPYAFFEMRNIFNGPNGTVGNYDDDEGAYAYVHTGYNDMYINRFRGALGVEWKIGKHNSLDLYFLGDYVQDVNIDTDKTQQWLKSRSIDKGFISTIGLGYKFKF